MFGTIDVSRKSRSDHIDITACLKEDRFLDLHGNISRFKVVFSEAKEAKEVGTRRQWQAEAVAVARAMFGAIVPAVSRGISEESPALGLDDLLLDLPSTSSFFFNHHLLLATTTTSATIQP